MILLVLGSQKFQFNRLVKEIDRLKASGSIQEEIIAQVGYTPYQPQHFSTYDFIEKSQLDNLISQANFVICHGGTGIIVSALKQGKKVIAVPRNQAFKEHVDNHQFQIVSMFSQLNYIEACENPALLEEAIQRCQTRDYQPFQSNHQHFINMIRKEIEDLARNS